MLSGHTHVFATFKRNKSDIITTSSAGGDTSNFNINSKSRGMEYYIHSINNMRSYIKFTRYADDFRVVVHKLDTDEEVYVIK